VIRTSLLLAVVAMVAAPQPADACMNGVEFEVNYDVVAIKKAEKYMESGNYRAAFKKLAKRRFDDARLRTKAKDMLAVIRVRTTPDGDDLASAVDHLAERSKAVGKKDVRFRAWLAEGLIATGKLDEGRAILVDLSARDLMPDAFAYLALAKASRGTERLDAWKACRARARNKAICTLPAEVVSTARS
jgi:hypothetical protein